MCLLAATGQITHAFPCISWYYCKNLFQSLGNTSANTISEEMLLLYRIGVSDKQNWSCIELEVSLRSSVDPSDSLRPLKLAMWFLIPFL
jgi:hypothetical protein